VAQKITVGEAKDHYVLHRLLAKVMVDAVETSGGFQVPPERLLDYRPSPAAVFSHKAIHAQGIDGSAE